MGGEISIGSSGQSVSRMRLRTRERYNTYEHVDADGNLTRVADEDLVDKYGARIETIPGPYITEDIESTLRDISQEDDRGDVYYDIVAGACSIEMVRSFHKSLCFTGTLPWSPKSSQTIDMTVVSMTLASNGRLVSGEFTAAAGTNKLFVLDVSLLDGGDVIG